MTEKFLSVEFDLEAVMREIENCTLMDDYFMKAFFEEDNSCAQTVLRIIMDKPDLVVISVKVQEEFSGVDGSHGVRFDVYAVDSDGTQYDIEIQKRADGASPYRADFNCAMMTVRTLKDSESHTVLANRKRVVIFITLTDVLKGKRPLYTIERVIREKNETFNDGTKIVYVNTSYKDTSTELGKLLHDFRCRNFREWYHSDMTEYAVKARKKVSKLSLIEDLLQKAQTIGKAEGKAEGLAEGKSEAQGNIALALIQLGKIALEDIAKCCHMTLEQVQELAATVKP